MEKRHIQVEREADIWINAFHYGELEKRGDWLQFRFPVEWKAPEVKVSRVSFEIKISNDHGIHTLLVGAEFVPMLGDTLEILIPTSGEISTEDGKICAMTRPIAEEALAELITGYYLGLTPFSLLPAGKLIFLASGFSHSESRWAKLYLAEYILSILPFFWINPEETVYSDMLLVYRYQGAKAQAKHNPQEADIPKLAQALKDENPLVRIKAAEYLCRIPSEEVVPFLIEAIPDSVVLNDVARELVKRRVKEAYTAILEEFYKIEEHDCPTQWALKEAIIAFGGEDAFELIMGLLDKGFELETLIREFGELKNTRIVPQLLEHFEKHEKLRGRIAYALGKIGDERAIPAISRLLHSEDFMEVEWAIWGLSKIGSEAAIKLLVEAYHFPNLDNKLRETVLRELHKIGKGDERVWDLLLQVCEDPKTKPGRFEFSFLFVFDAERAEKYYREQVKSTDLGTRIKAAYVLMDRVNAVEVQEILLENLALVDNETRFSLIWVLCKHGYAKILPFASEIILDEERETIRRIQIIVQLGGAKTIEAVPDLIRLLSSENLEIVFAVIEALGKIGDIRAVPALIAKLEDTRKAPGGIIYEWAEYALSNFKLPEVYLAINTAFRRRNHLDEYRK